MRHKGTQSYLPRILLINLWDCFANSPLFRIVSFKIFSLRNFVPPLRDFVKQKIDVKQNNLSEANLPLVYPIRIQFYKDKQQQRKRPEARPSIRKERQRHTYCREQPDEHGDIHKKVHKEY